VATAATLTVLVRADGINTLSRQLTGVHKDLTLTGAGARTAGADLDKAGKRGSRAIGGLKSVMGGLAGLAAFGAVSKGVHLMIDEFQEARKVGAQTAAVLKSTGGVANISAKQVQDLAGALSRKVGIDDEAIQSGQNLLLTFSRIRNETGKGNDVFNQTTKAALDMSVAMGTDMRTSALQLGKALNDPAKGLTRLTRSGVTFTDQQVKQIKALQASGDMLGAQKIIIGEVNREFGGSAAAAATPMDKLKVSVGNLAEAGGAVLVPALDKAAKVLTVLFDQMVTGRGVGGALVSTFRGLGTAIGAVVAVISGMVGWFRQNEAASFALATAVGGITSALVALRVIGIASAIQAWVALNAAFVTSPIGLVALALGGLVAALVIAYHESETFRDIVNGAFQMVKDVVGGVIGFLTGVIKGIADLFGGSGPRIMAAVQIGVVNAIIAPIRNAKDAFLALGGWVVARLRDGITGAAAAIVTAAGWIKNRVVEYVHNQVAGFISVGSWITNRVAEGIQVITSLFGAVGGWIKNRVTDLVHAQVEGFKGVGSWITNRVAEGIQVVTEALSGVGGWLKNRVMDAAAAAKEGFQGIGGSILDWIVDGLKAGANKVVGFLNKIIGVINKLPGVDIKPIADIKTDEKRKGGVFQAFAGGGAFARTGGLVASPITLMGEEAPRHPEFVIPTNPAYRSRAQGLAMQASSAVGLPPGVYPPGQGPRRQQATPGGLLPGLQQGGVYTASAYGPPWGGIQGTGVTADGTNLRGNPHVLGVAVDPRLIPLGSKLDIQPNPFGTQRDFKAFDTGGAIKGRRIDFYDWRGRGPQNAWGMRQVNVDPQGGSGILERVAGAVGDAVGAVGGIVGDLISGGAGFLLDQLPNPADMLPGWMHGLGRHAISGVSDWIRGKVSDVIGSFGGGAGGGGITGGPLPGDKAAVLKKLIKIANEIDAGDFPYVYGGGHVQPARPNPGLDCSSSVSMLMQHAGFGFPTMVSGAMMNYGMPGPGKQFTIWANPGHVFATIGGRDWGTNRGEPGGGPGWHSHTKAGFTPRHPGGLAQGGMFGRDPYLGAYATGGVVPRDGMAYVHQGETISPAGKGGPLVNIERLEVHEHLDWVREWRNVEQQLTAYGGR